MGYNHLLQAKKKRGESSRKKKQKNYQTQNWPANLLNYLKKKICSF